MKSLFQRIFRIRPSLLGRGCYLAAVIVTLTGTHLSAQNSITSAFTNPDTDTTANDNLATSKKGAVVIYSTPLAHGTNPFLIVHEHNKKVAFSKKKTSGPRLTVVDLGKSYKLNTVSLKFTNPVTMKVYVLKHKPDPNTPWTSLLTGLQPDAILDPNGTPVSLNGAEGEYLVVISDSDPGPFSNLYVTGNPSPEIHENPGYHDHDHDHDHDTGAPGETPHSGDDFHEHGHEPNPPPKST